MSHNQLFARSGTVIPILLTLGLFLCSCSSGLRGGDGDDLNPAIESFIAGDYETAISRLEGLAETTESGEQLRQIYLYLGRSYMATGQYDRAIDAFHAGKAYGGGSLFDEYLTRLGVVLAGTPETVSMSDRITRAQLAALIDRMFYAGRDDEGGAGERGVSKGAIFDLESVKRGVVPELPDGEFYPDAFVTRAAFYATVSRLVADIGTGVELTSVVDGGYDWVTAGQGEGQAEELARESFVTGNDTLTILLRVSQARAR